MKIKRLTTPKSTLVLILFFVFAGYSIQVSAIQNQASEAKDYNEYSGKVLDSKTNSPLIFASLSITDSNISTVTNADGEFTLKVPSDKANANLSVTFLGYTTKTISITSLKKKKNKIYLEQSVVNLSEVSLLSAKDARYLVKSTLENRKKNNHADDVLMTAFYRETIKKRRKNVSLAEAIVNLYKQSYASSKNDYFTLYKARKSTDYSRLDTIALKLQGGPYNPLYVDLMKYPEYIFTRDVIDLYTFNFLPAITINNKPVYVVNFKQRQDIEEPLYYGKLYIDGDTQALISAVYNLNVEDKVQSSKLFVRKKPKDVFAYPTHAAYRVDYKEKNGKWYYSYSNVQLTFKVNKKRRWFNSVYSLSSEMAVTDWQINESKIKNRDKLRKSSFITDEASGFTDPEFWGAYNVIEPEKTIETAIKKIQKQLKKASKS